MFSDKPRNPELERAFLRSRRTASTSPMHQPADWSVSPGGTVRRNEEAADTVRETPDRDSGKRTSGNSLSANRLAANVALFVAAALLFVTGCATYGGDYNTKRDNTAKGAGIGAGIGAAAAILDGKKEADEILAGAAIGAVLGAGVGAYMDAQEEKLARIPGTTVERVGPETLLVHFQSDVLFDVNSAVLDGSAQGALSQAGSVMNEYPKTAIVIQGHTDSSGSETHNQDLSTRRATAVEGYLVGRGVAPERMTAIGYGEGMPVASNESESGRQLNRRVDILLRAKAR